MRKIGLIILVATVVISLARLGYAQAVTGVKETPNKPTGASDVFKKPEIAKPAPDGEPMEQPTVPEVLPPGIAKRDDGDIPGKGKHLGWTQGQHKGREKPEATKASLEKLKGAVEEYHSQLKNWLNERPEFGITEEGGVSGYREAIKNWLKERPEANDIIKEIDASL